MARQLLRSRIITNPTYQQLDAYFRLRQMEYARDHRVSIPFSDHWDSKSQFVLACDGDQIIGGLRFAPPSSRSLPMHEEAPIFLQNYSVHLDGDYVVEAGRMAIAKTHRSTEWVRKLLSACLMQCRAQGIHKVVSITSAQTARMCKIVALQIARTTGKHHQAEIYAPPTAGQNFDFCNGYVTSLCVVTLQ